MGLQKDLTVFDSLVAKAAYYRIKTTIMEWEIDQVKFVMGGWVSREASKTGKSELPLGAVQEFVLDVPKGAEGGTKEEQYTMIKLAIPFFADATDVLEEEPKK